MTTRNLFAYAGRSRSREITLALNPADALMATYRSQSIERCVVVDQHTKRRYRIDDAGNGAIQATEVKTGACLKTAEAARLRKLAETALGIDPDTARRAADVAHAIRDIGVDRYTLRDLCEILCTSSDVSAGEIEDICKTRLDLLMTLVGSPMTLTNGGRSDLWCINLLANLAS